MKEADYIVATNVARLQIASDVLHRVLPVGGEERKRLEGVTREIAWLLQRYYYKCEHGF